MTNDELRVNETAQRVAINDAIALLNKNGKGEITWKNMENWDEHSFSVTLVDEEMRNRVLKNFAHFSHDTRVYEFTVIIGRSYFWSNRLDPFDVAVGITPAKKFSLYQKAVLRCAYRIYTVNETWRTRLFKEHPELK